MAIAFDSSSTWYRTTSWTITTTHTCSWTDRVIVVAVFVYWWGYYAWTVSAATYDWNDMTLLGSQEETWVTRNKVWFYYFIAPATWGKTVSVKFSWVSSWSIVCCSYTWVKQTTPFVSWGWAELSLWKSFSQSATWSSGWNDANSWGVWAHWFGNLWLSAWENTTLRLESTYSNGVSAIFDSNATIWTWVTLNASDGNARWAAYIATMLPVAAAWPANLKTINWLAKASVKTVNWLAIASVKTFNWLA